MTFSADHWAVILGGSSGFGLATAKRLAALGMSVCAVHRDRRAMLAKIEPEFEKIRAGGAKLLTFNTDALDAEKRREVVDALAAEIGRGRVRVLLHSVAFGNLKLLVAEAAPRPTRCPATSGRRSSRGSRSSGWARRTRSPTSSRSSRRAAAT